MTVINTNVNAMFAANALTANSRVLSNTMEQLSTGSRINSAKDDAAGLAISDKMTAQIRGLNMAVRNGNDAVSLLQTAEGSMIQQTNMLQRMRELAVQASGDTTLAADKTYLNTEFTSLRAEIDRIGKNTQWNGANVLDASGGAATNGTYNFQVGANAGQTISVAIGKMVAVDGSGSMKDISLSAVTTAASASAAITAIDLAIAAVDSQRATLGAGVNQLTYAVDNLTNVSQNATASRSQILDTDYAAATSKLAKSQIISQAATAMLAQANQQPQSVLALLK
ncbi:MAG: flagellin [Proteobacteria bacterium]|nr:flagellin [Pseudomonadota bacterium]